MKGQYECIILFKDTNHDVQSDTFLVNIYCNGKTIIDDALLYSNHIPILFHYFSCVAQVFTIVFLNWVNVISFYLVSSVSATIWHVGVTAWHNPSLTLSKIDLFHLMVYLFFPSLFYVFYGNYVP